MNKKKRTLILLEIATIGVSNYNKKYGTNYKSYEDAFTKTKEKLKN